MKYYVLFREDGVSAEGDFKYHNTLEEAMSAAQTIAGGNDEDYFIRAVEPNTFPEVAIEYDIYGKEI